MNLFEKMFNYQIISRLEDSGTFTVTAQERAWLKNMLEHPGASDAFMPSTREKLGRMLEQEPELDFAGALIEKAKNVEKQVYHPMLRLLRRVIMNRNALSITFQVKDGRSFHEQLGFPFKLEYSMVKREWYLLWHHLNKRAFMSTKLQHILSAVEVPFPDEDAERLTERISALLESRRETALIEVVQAYNKELSRILYAFSCFDKEVAYDAESDTYRITLTFPSDESETILSKIRFLGKRVRVVESGKLQRRMLETATKALDRYRPLEEPRSDDLQ
ncbi:WYL domain-containing protein [Paenibacillus sp. OAS669]|uniref:WYL domain-containing protein n=1 Tax=Paenibacillus sp. OAS669 TaxID=2663821 RepID=UPI001789804C|nr:WYL domain-containing protein [Paenibacillus sp. OAS669]MBE1444691.1 putative DNA-binding transcriptional regulator YafY [Paenibacillus sp. OAS669]